MRWSPPKESHYPRKEWDCHSRDYLITELVTLLKVHPHHFHHSKIVKSVRMTWSWLMLNTLNCLSSVISKDLGNGYSLKDKNQVKTDKTEHGIGKSVKSQKVK
ncbi:hypothetical protein Tco_1150389, partial [Tanacetum coccineum]